MGETSRSAREPHDIGSRRDRPTPGPRRSPQSPGSRPELICREHPDDPRKRQVVLSAGDACDIVEVHENGSVLAAINGEYHITSLTGRLDIRYQDRDPDKLPLFDDNPMIFKAGHDWQRDARQVRGISSGYYVVIAPNDWRRTGAEPVEYDPCTDPDYNAHYFHVQKGESAPDVGGFQGKALALTRSGFELIGDTVFDDSEDGELFVGTPPDLCPTSGVAWARVGPEEPRAGWRGTNFEPSQRTVADVLSDRQGRFYVRVYDAEVRLLDSGEFRYLRDLREIRVNGERYTANSLLVPSAAGHPPSEVSFSGVNALLTSPQMHAEVHSPGIVTVSPHPDAARLECALTCGTDSVDSVIRLPRIWWQIAGSDGNPYPWRDIAVTWSRQQFRDNALADAKVRLRLPSRIESVYMGFDDSTDLTYRTQRDGECAICTLSLADFSDHTQIEERLEDDSYLNVRCGDIAWPIIRLSADPPDTLSCPHRRREYPFSEHAARCLDCGAYFPLRRTRSERRL